MKKTDQSGRNNSAVERISVIGLGKLGLPLAACFADSGFATLGVDIDPAVVDAVNRGVSPMTEPGLQELIARCAGKSLFASQSYQQAIDQTDITFILVATPSTIAGDFSQRYVEDALMSLALALGKSRKPYHLFVISSTVTPGATEHSLIPVLEKNSGKKLDRDFGVCYNPDFVALGEVIKGFKQPEFVVIGECSPVDGQRIERLYRAMSDNTPPIRHLSFINAELAKVSLNAYITLKISFANSLANLCEQVPGANVDKITDTIGLDQRISPLYLKGGLSYGGTCFPRDTAAFMAVAPKYGCQSELLIATEKVNRFQDELLASKVIQLARAFYDCRVGMFGMSFKPGTSVINESPGVKLVHRLLEQNIKVVVYDELALEQVRAVFGSSVLYAGSALQCLRQSDLLVVTHLSKVFTETIEGYIPEKQKIVLDCWRGIDSDNLDRLYSYIPLGKNIVI